MATQHVSRPKSVPSPAVVAAATGRQEYDEPIPGVGEQPAAAPAPAPSSRPRKASAVKLEEVEFENIRPSAETTFAPKSKAIPDNHPLMIAFRRSYTDQAGLDVTTKDPVALTKILRRIANQEGKGVSVKTHDDGCTVSFRAQDRKKVVRKKPAAGAE